MENFFEHFPILPLLFPFGYTTSMGAREEVVKKIDRKEQEMRELELQIREARAYIQGMEEVLKLLPKESAPINPDQVLRPGTAIHNAREAIKNAGKPLHISDLLKALSMDVNKKNRLSLSGSLSGYARRGEVFTRPAPNTFGLVELGGILKPQSASEPPEEFGAEPAESEMEFAPISDSDVPF